MHSNRSVSDVVGQARSHMLLITDATLRAIPNNTNLSTDVMFILASCLAKIANLNLPVDITEVRNLFRDDRLRSRLAAATPDSLSQATLSSLTRDTSQLRGMPYSHAPTVSALVQFVTAFAFAAQQQISSGSPARSLSSSQTFDGRRSYSGGLISGSPLSRDHSSVGGSLLNASYSSAARRSQSAREEIADMRRSLSQVGDGLPGKLTEDMLFARTSPDKAEMLQSALVGWEPPVQDKKRLYPEETVHLLQRESEARLAARDETILALRRELDVVSKSLLETTSKLRQRDDRMENLQDLLSLMKKYMLEVSSLLGSNRTEHLSSITQSLEKHLQLAFSADPCDHTKLNKEAEDKLAALREQLATVSAERDVVTRREKMALEERSEAQKRAEIAEATLRELQIGGPREHQSVVNVSLEAPQQPTVDVNVTQLEGKVAELQRLLDVERARPAAPANTDLSASSVETIAASVSRSVSDSVRSQLDSKDAKIDELSRTIVRLSEEVASLRLRLEATMEKHEQALAAMSSGGGGGGDGGVSSLALQELMAKVNELSVKSDEAAKNQMEELKRQLDESERSRAELTQRFEQLDKEHKESLISIRDRTDVSWDAEKALLKLQEEVGSWLSEEVTKGAKQLLGILEGERGTAQQLKEMQEKQEKLLQLIAELLARLEAARAAGSPDAESLAAMLKKHMEESERMAQRIQQLQDELERRRLSAESAMEDRERALDTLRLEAEAQARKLKEEQAAARREKVVANAATKWRAKAKETGSTAAADCENTTRTRSDSHGHDKKPVKKPDDGAEMVNRQPRRKGRRASEKLRQGLAVLRLTNMGGARKGKLAEQLGNMTPEDLFRRMDADQSGFLTREEVREGLQSMTKMPAEEIQDLLQNLRVEDDGLIDPEEFLNKLTDGQRNHTGIHMRLAEHHRGLIRTLRNSMRKHGHTDVRELFETHQDEDSLLCTDGFRELAEHVEAGLSNLQLSVLFRACDIDDSQALDFDEFYALMTSV